MIIIIGNRLPNFANFLSSWLSTLDTLKKKCRSCFKVRFFFTYLFFLGGGGRVGEQFHTVFDNYIPAFPWDWESRCFSIPEIEYLQFLLQT